MAAYEDDEDVVIDTDDDDDADADEFESPIPVAKGGFRRKLEVVLRAASATPPCCPSNIQSPRVDSAVKTVDGQAATKSTRNVVLSTKVRTISRSQKVRMRGRGAFFVRCSRVLRRHWANASHPSGKSGKSASPASAAAHIGPLR